MEPPLILMAIRPDSELYNYLAVSRQAAIHFPEKTQQDMVSKFFKIKERTENSLNGYKFSFSERKNVLLDEISMFMEVVVLEIKETGDHHLFICEVISTMMMDDYDTLNMSDTNWKYGG